MSFLEHFESVEDPRKEIDKQHKLLDIEFLTASAFLYGVEGWKAIKEFGGAKLDWLR